MKTVLLFLTIMLVGSGWTFIKHVFSDREKKLFLVVFPLQLLVYVAHVCISSSYCIIIITGLMVGRNFSKMASAHHRRTNLYSTTSMEGSSIVDIALVQVMHQNVTKHLLELLTYNNIVLCL